MITDVGDENDVHPKQKKPVGERLSLLARKLAYGEKIVASGPTFRSLVIDSNHAVLHFDNIGSGLMADGAKLTGFAIAGADKKFVRGDAVISGDTVVVSSPSVPVPVAVRYGWADYPVVNLRNKEGLLACPFRTDVPEE